MIHNRIIFFKSERPCVDIHSHQSLLTVFHRQVCRVEEFLFTLVGKESNWVLWGCLEKRIRISLREKNLASLDEVDQILDCQERIRTMRYRFRLRSSSASALLFVMAINNGLLADNITLRTVISWPLMMNQICHFLIDTWKISRNLVESIQLKSDRHRYGERFSFFTWAVTVTLLGIICVVFDDMQRTETVKSFLNYSRLPIVNSSAISFSSELVDGVGRLFHHWKQ